MVWISPEISVSSETAKGFHAMTLAPMNPILVRCKVHELDLVKLKTGDRGTIVFDAMPDKKYPCKVSRIPWTSRNAALEVPADYDIECLLENQDGKIKDGLTCNVQGQHHRMIAGPCPPHKRWVWRELLASFPVFHIDKPTLVPSTRVVPRQWLCLD